MCTPDLSLIVGSRFVAGYLNSAILMQMTLAPRDSYKEGDFEETDERSPLITRDTSHGPLISEGEDPIPEVDHSVHEQRCDKVREPLVGAMIGRSVKEQLFSSYYW